MTWIFEVYALRCGYAAARDGLRHVVEQAIRNGGETMALNADLGPAAICKRAIVRYERALDATRFDELWSIRWVAQNGGPYPEFSGIIAVHHESDGLAQLEIRGEYMPPFGVWGNSFDLALGQRIASQTCRHLLRRLAERIECRCAI